MEEFIDDADEFIDDAAPAMPTKQDQVAPIQNTKGEVRGGLTPNWQKRLKPFKLANGIETVQRDDGYLWLDPSKGDPTKQGWYKWEGGQWAKGPDEPEKDQGIMGFHLSPLANLLSKATGSNKIPNPTIANVVQGGKNVAQKLFQTSASVQSPSAVPGGLGFTAPQLSQQYGMTPEREAEFQRGGQEAKAGINDYIDRQQADYRERYNTDVVGESIVPSVLTLPLGGTAATLGGRAAISAGQAALGQLISRPVENANQKSTSDILKSEAGGAAIAGLLGGTAVPVGEYVVNPVAGAIGRKAGNALARTRLGGMLGMTEKPATIGLDVNDLKGLTDVGDRNALNVQEDLGDYADLLKSRHRKTYNQAWEQFGDSGIGIDEHIKAVDEEIANLNRPDVPGGKDLAAWLENYKSNLLRRSEHAPYDEMALGSRGGGVVVGPGGTSVNLGPTRAMVDPYGVSGGGRTIVGSANKPVSMAPRQSDYDPMSLAGGVKKAAPSDNVTFESLTSPAAREAEQVGSPSIVSGLPRQQDPAYRTFAELNRNRSDLGMIISDAYKGGKLYADRATASFQRLRNNLSDLMQEGAAKTGKYEAYSTLQRANREYAEFANIFNKNDIKALNRAQNVDDVVALISRKGDSAMKNLKAALGPEGAESLRAAYIQRLMERSKGEPLALLKDADAHSSLIRNFFEGADAMRLNGLMKLAKFSRNTAMGGGAAAGATLAHLTGGHGEGWAALTGLGAGRFYKVPAEKLFQLFRTPTGQNILLQLGAEKVGTKGFNQAARNAMAIATQDEVAGEAEGQVNKYRGSDANSGEWVKRLQEVK